VLEKLVLLAGSWLLVFRRLNNEILQALVTRQGSSTSDERSTSWLARQTCFIVKTGYKTNVYSIGIFSVCVWLWPKQFHQFQLNELSTKVDKN